MGTTIDKQTALVLPIFKKHPRRWFSRKDLCSALKLNQLNVRIILALDLLTEQDVIERRQAPTTNQTVYRWEYRIKEAR